MPEAYYKAGIKFIELLDQVLDVEIDYKTAYENSEHYIDVIKEYGDYENAESKDEEIKRLGYSVDTTAATLIRIKLKPNGLTGYSEECGLEELLEDRNEFAEKFNVEAREK
ncbi:MAG: hypothetical protein IJZ64_02965 [Ruminococcus sp.]|nr:hypothetical protein [Ruminococcus sp.]